MAKISALNSLLENKITTKSQAKSYFIQKVILLTSDKKSSNVASGAYATSTSKQTPASTSTTLRLTTVSPAITHAVRVRTPYPRRATAYGSRPSTSRSTRGWLARDEALVVRCTRPHGRITAAGRTWGVWRGSADAGLLLRQTGVGPRCSIVSLLLCVELCPRRVFFVLCSLHLFVGRVVRPFIHGQGGQGDYSLLFCSHSYQAIVHTS